MSMVAEFLPRPVDRINICLPKYPKKEHKFEQSQMSRLFLALLFKIAFQNILSFYTIYTETNCRGNQFNGLWKTL